MKNILFKQRIKQKRINDKIITEETKMNLPDNIETPLPAFRREGNYLQRGRRIYQITGKL